MFPFDDVIMEMGPWSLSWRRYMNITLGKHSVNLAYIHNFCKIFNPVLVLFYLGNVYLYDLVQIASSAVQSQNKDHPAIQYGCSVGDPEFSIFDGTVTKILQPNL